MVQVVSDTQTVGPPFAVGTENNTSTECLLTYADNFGSGWDKYIYTHEDDDAPNPRNVTAKTKRHRRQRNKQARKSRKVNRRR